MQWTALPNSNIGTSGVAPLLPGGGSGQGSQAIIQPWVSAAPDAVHGILYYTRHGGHGDYAGNQVIKYDLNTQTGYQLVIPWSTAYPPSNTTTSGLYPDGTPASVHTYGAECYMPSVNRIWSGGGIYWHAGGDNDHTTFEVDLNATPAAWRDVPDRPGTSGYSCVSCWDPVTNRVLFLQSSGFYAYDPAATPPTYTTLFTGLGTGWGAPAGAGRLDESGGLALGADRKCYISRKQSTAPFLLYFIDLNNLAARVQNVPVTGAVDILNGIGTGGRINAMGLLWDTDRLVALTSNVAGTTAELATLDPDDRVWVRRPATNTTPIPIYQGTWNKFFMYNGAYYHALGAQIARIVPDFQSQVLISVVTGLDLDITNIAPPGPALQPNTWTLLPAPPPTAPVSERTGKHMRLAWDSVRSRWLIAAGDRFGSDAGQPAIQGWDPTTGLHIVLSPMCVPAPGFMPNFPDNAPFCYDSTRDRFYLFRGYWNVAPWDKRLGSGGWPATTLTLSAVEGEAVTVTSNVAGTFDADYYATTARWMIQDTSPSPNAIVGLGVFTGWTSTTQATIKVGRYPAGALTPGATSGDGVTFTAPTPTGAESAFQSTINTDSGHTFNYIGRELVVLSGPSAGARATITTRVSASQVVANITVPFASTAAISGGAWKITWPFSSTTIASPRVVFRDVLGGVAALKPGTGCDRNNLAGDTGVLNVDCVFNPVTNKYEERPWSAAPYGIASDVTGPSWAAYDPVTDSVYTHKGGFGLSILKCGTWTWTTKVIGAGMPTGPERTLVTQHNSYRCVIVVANGNVYFMSNRVGQEGLIRYNIAADTWHGYAVPQTPFPYAGINDGAEPQLVHDPVSNVLLHVVAQDLTGPITGLYPFSLTTHQWLTPRTIPTIPGNVDNGCAVWNPGTASMMIGMRFVSGVTGYSAWHYKYAP